MREKRRGGRGERRCLKYVIKERKQGREGKKGKERKALDLQQLG